jgi:hypothetical protein
MEFCKDDEAIQIRPNSNPIINKFSNMAAVKPEILKVLCYALHSC